MCAVWGGALAALAGQRLLGAVWLREEKTRLQRCCGRRVSEVGRMLQLERTSDGRAASVVSAQWV
jgi:hypothetical protein